MALWSLINAVAAISYVVEWVEEQGAKRPYLIHRADDKLLWAPAFVGPSLDERGEMAFAICTREPNKFFSHFHDRMIGVLTPALAERWLRPDRHTRAQLRDCVAAPGEHELVAHAIATDLSKRRAGDWSALAVTGPAKGLEDLAAKSAPASRRRASAQ